jgi:hypothetical protein
MHERAVARKATEQATPEVQRLGLLFAVIAAVV